MGSPLPGTPAADAVTLLSTNVYNDSQKAQFTASIYGRIRNLLLACQSIGLDRGEAERRTRACFDPGVSAAQVGSPLPRTGADTVVPAVAARTAVGRVELDGYKAGLTSGYAQVCVVAGEGGIHRDPEPATGLGFRPPSDQQQTFATIDIRVVPFGSVAEATARIATDGSLAAACSGQLQNPDPKFVPTFATAHGTVPTASGGVFTAWRSATPGGPSTTSTPRRGWAASSSTSRPAAAPRTRRTPAPTSGCPRSPRSSRPADGFRPAAQHTLRRSAHGIPCAERRELC